MKAKLLAMMQQLKSTTMSLASKWPLPVGVAMGYILHPEIKLVLDMAGDLVKVTLRML